MSDQCGRDKLLRILIEAGEAEISRNGSLKAAFSAVLGGMARNSFLCLSCTSIESWRPDGTV